MQFKTLVFSLIAGIAFGWLPLGSVAHAAEEADALADEILELRNSIGGSVVSGDDASFKEAVERAAKNAASSEATKCSKGCDLCQGDCKECPVDGCANCKVDDRAELPSCCCGKLPSRVDLKANAPVGLTNLAASNPQVISNSYAKQPYAYGNSQGRANSNVAGWGGSSYTQNQAPTQNPIFQQSGWMNRTRQLYESAMQLEQVAHRLELQNLLDEADKVRAAAIELRRSARQQPTR